MTSEELLEKLNEIRIQKCETRTLELKAAEKECPKRLYDTLSFSNQDDGGSSLKKCFSEGTEDYLRDYYEGL